MLSECNAYLERQPPEGNQPPSHVHVHVWVEARASESESIHARAACFRRLAYAVRSPKKEGSRVSIGRRISGLGGCIGLQEG